MDTSQEYQKVLQKKEIGAPLSWRELAVYITNQPDGILMYIADNDFAQAYTLLHHSDSVMRVGAGANFFPEKGRVIGELKALLAKEDVATLNDILSNYKINLKAGNITSNNNMVTALRDIDAIKPGADGNYQFTMRYYKNKPNDPGAGLGNFFHNNSAAQETAK